MEEALWKSADKLRGSVEPAEYKHVVLSLFFLKFASYKFEECRRNIIEYPDEKMIELSKRIKKIVDDKSRYTDWSTREDIKVNLQVDLILLLDEFGYSPVTLDDVYKEVLEQAENFKKYS